jgi:hypothetical protein
VDNPVAINSSINYTCKAGYFFESNRMIASQKITCLVLIPASLLMFQKAGAFFKKTFIYKIV